MLVFKTQIVPVCVISLHDFVYVFRKKNEECNILKDVTAMINMLFLKKYLKKIM